MEQTAPPTKFRKNAFAIILVLLAILPWTNYVGYPHQNLFTTISAFFASILLVALCFLLKAFIAHLGTRSNFQKSVVVTIALGMVGIIALHRQGVVSYDDLNILNSFAYGHPQLWSSFIYSVLLQALQFIYGEPFATIAVTSALYLILFTLGVEIAGKTDTPRGLTFGILALAFAPLTQTILLFQNRDSIFTLLFLVLFLALRRNEASRSAWSNGQTLVLSALFGCLACLRFDGLVPASAFLLYVFISQYFNRVAKITAAATVTTVFLLFGLFASLTNPDPKWRFRDRYQTSLLINPLSAVLSKHGVKSLTNDEYDAINRYFKIGFFDLYPSPEDINPFHFGGVRVERSHDDFLLFRKTALDLILRYPGDWFERRAIIAKSMLGFGNYRYIFSDLRRPNLRHIFAAGQKFFGYENPPPEPNTIERQYREWLVGASHGPLTILGVIFNSMLFPLVGLCWAILAWKQSLAFALLSGAAIVRLFLFLAIAPATYFKYISTAWLGGWLMLIFLLGDWVQRRRKART